MNEQERAVIWAAVSWVREHPPGLGDIFGDELQPLRDAVRALHESQEPPGPRTEKARPMTWGTVPAGWYVQAPDGEWYEVTHTGRMGPVQMVTMAGIGAHPRKLEGPVTACPGPPNATDDAIEALGYPEVLEDGA